MTSRLLISLSVLLIAAQKISAQLAPAEDFFNTGAQLYISNNVPAALERVEMGLKTYPDDEKLKKLEELLKQKQQQQQNQQQQNQQNQQQQSQQDQKQQDKKDQQPKPDQKQQQDQKQNSDQKKDEEQKQQQQKIDSSDKQKDEQKEQQGQPVKAGEMTPEEAKRLLDAQKGNEQLLQMKPQDKPRDPNRPVKDW
jgi:Ca-activated chloride channel family protein